ncbi:MAG TPA: PDZ domain-containing protein [Chthoniobacterales bacterium]|nr:PDZ domain-containing protein [Chthoniobacterales bacterium]
MRKIALLIICLAGMPMATASGAEKAWYGFHIKPDTAGFPLNPTVRSVVIDKVKANSPATAHGIRVGDEIIEAEGKTVPGRRAIQLISILNKRPGELLQLRLRRPDGTTYFVQIRGIKKPAS